MTPDLTELEIQFSRLVGNGLQMVLKGAVAVLAESIKQGKIRAEVGQALIAMQMATGCAMASYQLRIGPDSLKALFDDAYQQMQREEAALHDPGHA